MAGTGAGTGGRTGPTTTTSQTSPYSGGSSPSPSAQSAVSQAEALARAKSVSAVLSRGFQVRSYTIKASNVTEQAFGEQVTYKSALVYAAKAVANGILTANDADIYVGRHPTILPELRSAGDPNTPVIFESATGDTFKLTELYVQGTAGDGIVVLFY